MWDCEYRVFIRIGGTELMLGLDWFEVLHVVIPLQDRHRPQTIMLATVIGIQDTFLYNVKEEKTVIFVEVITNI